MSRWKRLLEARDVERALKNLGFKYRNSEGSHDNWVPADSAVRFRKVTVDKPKAPFGDFLMQSMARQAGVTLKEFYAAADK